MKILNLFKKKKYNWVNINFKRNYDLSKIIFDLSPNSRIKRTSITYRFKYCSINNKLMQFITPDIGFEKVDLEESIKKFPELKKEIDKLNIDKRRDLLINKILKK